MITISNALFSFLYFPFHHFQFLFSLPQYSWLYYLFDYLNNFFAINLLGSFSFLNILFFCSCLLISSMSCQYSFLNSLIASLVFSRFFLSFQVFDSTINLFYLTKYLFFPLTYYLFKILSNYHSSSSSIITRASCSFLCLFTCHTYLYILLILTTRYIFTILGSSNLTAIMPQINFPQKITSNILYTNGFLIRICSGTLSIFSECNTI